MAKRDKKEEAARSRRLKGEAAQPGGREAAQERNKARQRDQKIKNQRVAKAKALTSANEPQKPPTSNRGRRAQQHAEELSQAREALGHQTGTIKGQAKRARQGLVKKTIHVKAYVTSTGRKVPDHDETYYETPEQAQETKSTGEGDHMNQSHFDAGIAYSDYQKFGRNKGSEANEGEGGPELNQSPAPSANATARTYGSLGGGPADPYGTYGDLNLYTSDQIAQIAGAVAADIYQYDTDPQASQNNRQEQAAREAIYRLQEAYNTQHGQGLEGKGKRPSQASISLENLDTGSVRSYAFPRRVEKLSAKEQAQRFPSKKQRKTNLGQSGKGAHADHLSDRLAQLSQPRLFHSATHPKSRKLGEWDPQELQQALAKKRERASTLRAGDTVSKGKLNSRQFMNTLSSDESDWVTKQTEDPNGLFFGMKNNRVPGAYRRWQRYMNARQSGYEDLNNISEWLTTDTRGRATNPNRAGKAESQKRIKERYTKGIVSKEGRKQSDRYSSRAPSHEDFGVGIKVPGIPSERELKESYPDASPKELLEYKQSDIQSVQEEILKNQRAAHEERQEIMMGRKPGDSGASNEDRVVFFTTSAGYPAISVGADSTIGQYIIKKRKAMIYNDRGASRAQLKGEFPHAVRDQHLIEIATGLSVGAQGRYGAFRQVGYKAGNKKSKGFGRVMPLGSQILRDSAGQPIYDRNGNVRYTEGFTRPFDLRSSNEVGLRIYVG